jgi:hypothetical protein
MQADGGEVQPCPDRFHGPRHPLAGLPDPVTDPGGYVLAVADLRLDIAMAADVKSMTVRAAMAGYRRALREFVAAEASEDLALAQVALWRGIVERHAPHPPRGPSDDQPECRTCEGDDWPCPDLLAAVDAARAYMGGGAA